MRSGGNSRTGYRDRYDAALKARTKVKDWAFVALAIAERMKVFVRMLVGRAMHVAIVKGLNK